ncbi:unnamed protein product [Paramecium pentaurelia]|uniref:RING-type domain-containing protein n=1 Tax=Paramecium pentaurelia TaxID=43138 RepID=A0A8S1US69_9CILI|nr:unnamed protein product [Paramecium pentaurelia]
MEIIYPEPDSDQSEQNRELNQVQKQGQCQVKFRLIFYIYKLVLLYLAMNIIFCIFVGNKNNDYNQIIYFCILVIILMVIIIICLLYQYCSFQEAENKVRQINEQTQIEIDANSILYQSTLKFMIAFTNQSKYLWIKIILLYCSLCIIMFISQIYQSQISICMCFDSIENIHKEFIYSELQCILDKDCKIKQIETISFPYIKQVIYINWPIIAILMVLQIAQVFFMVFSFFQNNCCCSSFKIQEFQHVYNNKQKQKAISFGSFLSGSIIFYSLGKLIVLSLLMILTQNETCYVLVSSNLFYYLLIIIVFNQIRHTINCEQAVEVLCYQNSQILIDSIIFRKNFRNEFFRIGLILCLIFTTIGQLIYKKHKKYTNIINYDIFIEFDCGIFQFIMLIILIYKYIIYQHCNKLQQLIFQKNNNGSIQEISTNQSSIQNQSQLINSRVQTQPNNNVILINQQDNLLNQLKFTSQNQPTYMIVKPQTSQMDCMICLDKLEKGSSNVVQLKCHQLHMFHIICIKTWFYRHRRCPTCNQEFID